MTTTPWAAPIVVARQTDPGAPLVILLHGRGATEVDILGLADLLPPGPTYAAVRAPIAEGGGYAWFENRGVGRPVADSLTQTTSWFRSWLDDFTPPARPVVLIGFSGGAAFAGGLALADPGRYAGMAILYGTLPFDAGMPTTPARLAGLPVFLAHGQHDSVIPAELQARTWTYLLGESGAPTTARRDPIGHTISPTALDDLGRWLTERLAFLARRGPHRNGPTTDVAWATLPDGILPARAGERPQVSHEIPQQQLGQTAPVELQEQVFEHAISLAGVVSRPSAISVPGARGLMLPPALAAGPADAFIVPAVGEFAHLHPPYDGSLHIALPAELAADTIARGWAIAHPLAGVRLTPGMVMIYGPRDSTEVPIIAGLVEASHRYASSTV